MFSGIQHRLTCVAKQAHAHKMRGISLQLFHLKSHKSLAYSLSSCSWMPPRTRRAARAECTISQDQAVDGSTVGTPPKPQQHEIQQPDGIDSLTPPPAKRPRNSSKAALGAAFVAALAAGNVALDPAFTLHAEFPHSTCVSGLCRLMRDLFRQ
jgi:hypothetical protein